MVFYRPAFVEGVRASLPVLLGVVPFGVITMAIVTYLARSSFLLLPPGVETPPWLRRALRYVPAAVLTAIWAPELALQKEVLSLTLHNERLLAGLLAIAVAWRFRATFVTIVSGLLALHLFDWLL